MKTESSHISRSSPELKSQDFGFLRNEAMERIRTIAAGSWTDHNLHDPGITILEACCYALTEMGLRAGMDIADLVASDRSGYQQDFYSAADILPVSPITGTDMRKILMDHPAVKKAWLYPRPKKPGGRYSVLLEFSEERLNSNTFAVSVGSEPYQVDVAFPYWDEKEMLPFQNDVEIQSIDFDTGSGDEWRSISGDQIWYARLNVTFQTEGGGTGNTEFWVIAAINTPMENPTTEVPAILPGLTDLVTEIGDNSPDDESLLKRVNRRVTDALRTLNSVRRYVEGYRNLCETFTDFQAVRPQEVAVTAAIEVGSGLYIEELIADMFLEIDHHIAPDPGFRSMQELNSSGDKMFEGPLLDSGFLPEELIRQGTPKAKLYTSDILRLMLKVRKPGEPDELSMRSADQPAILSVRSVSLANYLDNRPVTTRARDCLHLVESRRHIPVLSLTKSTITVYRNGVNVSADTEKIIELFQEKKEEKKNRAEGIQDSGFLRQPRGERYDIEEYYPIQNDLPVVYGTGEAGLPDTAPDERRALAKQLKGYLFFFEQLTSGVASQLAHVNALFSSDPDIEQTLFQQPLYHLPGVGDLFREFRPSTQQGEDYWNEWDAFTGDTDNGYMKTIRESVETPGQFLLRRNRNLDHLLATFGEDMRDRSSFILNNTTSGEERRLAYRQLIGEKSALIRDLPGLNRDRAQSFGNPVFRNENLMHLRPEEEAFHWSMDDGDGAALFRSVSPDQTGLSARRTAADTLVLATSENQYSVFEESSGDRRLRIGPWPGAAPLAESETTYDTQAEAEAAIVPTVEKVLELWHRYTQTPLERRVCHMLGVEKKERRLPDEPFGTDPVFFMVEHLLLYPEAEAGPHLEIGESGDPWSFQVTFLFPSGYRRDFSDDEAEKEEAEPGFYNDPEFRRFAETQIRKACPAHILPRVLWTDQTREGTPDLPDNPSFENAEDRYHAWLRARFTHGMDSSGMESARENFVDILNAIYLENGHSI